LKKDEIKEEKPEIKLLIENFSPKNKSNSMIQSPTNYNKNNIENKKDKQVKDAYFGKYHFNKEKAPMHTGYNLTTNATPITNRIEKTTSNNIKEISKLVPKNTKPKPSGTFTQENKYIILIKFFIEVVIRKITVSIPILLKLLFYLQNLILDQIHSTKM